MNLRGEKLFESETGYSTWPLSSECRPLSTFDCGGAILEGVAKVAEPFFLGENMSSETGSESTGAKNGLRHNWRDRFEELLKVKNIDDLKSELTKIGSDLQDEIKNFDLQEHLSPTAKDKLKTLETRYADVLKTLKKAQKQFDRDFSKSIQTLKKTSKDAEKRLLVLRSKVDVHRKKVVKASETLRARLAKSTGRKVKKSGAKRSRKKVTTA